jgi:cell division protein CrgA
VPKSRVRQKAVYTPPPAKTTAKRKVSAPWVAPGIVVGLIVGLAWIVVYYTADPPGMSALGGWNLLVGFAFIIGAVILATNWR